MQETARRFDINKIFTTASHKEANGQNERSVKAVARHDGGFGAERHGLEREHRPLVRSTVDHVFYVLWFPRSCAYPYLSSSWRTTQTFVSGEGSGWTGASTPSTRSKSDMRLA